LVFFFFPLLFQNTSWFFISLNTSWYFILFYFINPIFSIFSPSKYMILFYF
jgi:hypothetical protein